MDDEKNFYEMEDSSDDLGDLLGTSDSSYNEDASIYDDDDIFGDDAGNTYTGDENRVSAEDIVDDINPLLPDLEGIDDSVQGTPIDVGSDVFSVDGDIVAEGDDVTPEALDLSGIDIGDIDDISVDASDSVESDDLVSSEEKLRLFSDKIISSCIGDKEITRYALDKLTMVANPRLFRDENYIIFSVFYAYRSRLRYINIDSEFIKLFLNRNRKLVSNAREYVDISAYGEVDGSVELGYIAGVVKHFNRLKTLPELSVSEFETCFEKYLIEFKAIEAAKVYRQAQIILTDGLKVGRKQYSGFDDSQSYCKKKLAEIEGLVDMNVGSGFIKSSELLMEEKPDNRKPIKIGDFGMIELLNEAYGGIFTGLFYSYIAPPKAGKSKFAARLCHTIAIVYGNNVTVWAQEGGHEMWSAQLRAIHFDYVYNTDANATDIKYGVSQETIMRDSFKSDELRELELSSKLDLASNQNYGTIDYIDRPFEVETFLEDIDTSVKENNSKCIIIDYMQLIGSAKGMSERERITEAYKSLLAYAKKNNVAVISPAQIKQDSFDEMMRKSSLDGVDLRTAGGGSSEVLRSPDVIFALWSTVDDLRNNSMKIISMPCRMNKAFPNIDLVIDLGTCSFISVDS